MAKNPHFSFTQKVTSSGFSRALSERVDRYFHDRGISRLANTEMVFKTILGFAMWAGTYLWLLGAGTVIEVVVRYVAHGFAQLFMGLNIAHDANHGAYSRHRPINRVLGYVFDLVGLSSYMWRLMHNDSHHAFINVREADTALATGTLLRLSPHDPRKRFHRFQHLYAPFLYCLPTLDWVFAKDFRWLAGGRFGNRKIIRHSRGELLLLLLGKAFYYSYMLIIPLLALKAPSYAVLLGFTVMHCFLGATLALTFQPNHFTPDSSFPRADDRGGIANNYIQHVFDTTADYARRNGLATFALGGLNLHTVHHMFPGVCHTHYRALTKILISTAQEYGLRYRENRGILHAFRCHLRWLKTMGTTDLGQGCASARRDN